MLNHSDRSTGPFCTDCHGYGRIHDSALNKPFKNSTHDNNGMWNSTLCMTCHADRRPHASTGPNNNTLECSGCHANASLYEDRFANDSKQIHGIRYLKNTGKYSDPGDNTSTIGCQGCHLTNNITYINLSYPDTLATPPKPMPSADINHSSSAAAGAKWGRYWNDTDDYVKNDSCYYCHGSRNVFKGVVTSDPKHNESGLGRVNIALGSNSTAGYDNIINSSINQTSKWCGSCHYKDNVFFNDMMLRLDADGALRPPNITDMASWTALDGTQGFNHSKSMDYYGDSDHVCKICHGSLLSSAPTMDEFPHNVRAIAPGGPTPNCLKCHSTDADPLSQLTLRHVDNSTMSQSEFVHLQLNNLTGDPGPAEDPSMIYPWQNRRCWACHGNGSVPINETMDRNPLTPKLCPDCHLATGSENGQNPKYPTLRNYTVSEHIPNGTDIQASYTMNVIENIKILLSNQSNFDDGTYVQTFRNTTTGALQLDSSQGYTSGTYTSQSFKPGNLPRWDNISWTQGAPYGQELPDNKGIEDVLGSVDMAANVLLMHLDEASGAIVDSSGEGNDGTANGAVIYSDSGKLNTSLGFYTDNDYISLDSGNSGNLNSQYVTLSIWARSNVTNTSYTANGYLFDRKNTQAGTVSLFLEQTTAKIQFHVRLDVSEGTTRMAEANSVLDTSWHHYLGTYDGDKTKLYVDGVLQTTQNDQDGAIDRDGADSISIGADANACCNWNGTIDELAVWNRSLTSTEVLNVYKRGGLRLDLSVRSLICDTMPCLKETFTDITEDRKSVV